VSQPTPSLQQVVGRVQVLRAYPVKSMDAPDLEQARVLPTGLEHDRGWAVVGDDDQVVTARQVDGLRAVRASAPAAADGSPALRLAGSQAEVSGADADAALSQAIGRAVAIRRAQDGAFTEVAPVHVVSRQAVERAAADEGTTLGDPACSIEEPRANVVLELDAQDGELETSWVGREVHLGEVVLRVSKQPQHCLGVYADVVRPGVVRVGDAVRLG
jgi:uncharacterized protein YcbX